MQLEMEQMRLQMADMQAAQMQAEQENQMLRTHSEQVRYMQSNQYKQD